ncbi:MAG TPA: hypothetical protein VLB68_00505 [Pyrinomonadaceae bacterium]|nr:hypothetical protein [Pyrinomonadaceae bacterium]
MFSASSTKPESVTQTIGELIEVSKFDTLYRDLYLQRARKLMSTTLSEAAYTNIKEGMAVLGLLEHQLRAAIEQGNWTTACEFTDRVSQIRKSAAAKSASIGLAEVVYDRSAKVPVDPFSPGFHVFLNASTEDLREWREHALEILSRLTRIDSSMQDLYTRRLADFQALKITAQTEQKDRTSAVGATVLQQEALSAFDSGNLSQLNSVLEALIQKAQVKETKQESTAITQTEDVDLGPDLLFSFSETTLAAARKLGLAHVRTHSRRHLGYLAPYAWQPSFLKTESRNWARNQLINLIDASNSAGHLRDAIEVFLLNPLISSGGTHYRPCLVAEDLLVEDFAEPAPRAELAQVELLAVLGFERRWGLTRMEIENALLQHGPRILKEQLGLDPEAFRLVAIPADIYIELGAERGWGQREIWTHFDGYWVREGGKLQPLAGGDKRFGGVHDIISFSPAYSTDRLLVRFAVVQRKRMMTWHQKG